MGQGELAAVPPRAAAEAGDDLAGAAVEHVDHDAVLIQHVQPALFGVGRERRHHRRAPRAAGAALRGCERLPRHVDVPDEGALAVEHLNAVGLAVADVDEAVAGHPQAVGNRGDVLLVGGPVQRPLAQELPVVRQHRDAPVPARELAVRDVDLAGLRVDVDGGGQEELRAVRVQGRPGARAVRRVVAPRLADAEQQLAVARVLLHHPGAGGDDPQVAVGVGVAVVQAAAQGVGVSPRADDAAVGVELDDGRGQRRPVKVLGDDVLPVEDEDVVAAVHAHAAEPAREHAVPQGHLGPGGVEFVLRNLLCGGARRQREAQGGDDPRRRRARAAAAGRRLITERCACSHGYAAAICARTSSPTRPATRAVTPKNMPASRRMASDRLNVTSNRLLT